MAPDEKQGRAFQTFSVERKHWFDIILYYVHRSWTPLDTKGLSTPKAHPESVH